MDRTPPVAVRRALRQEVGFGCPVPGCGNPYLEYHHFDPPWRLREHHEPAGMVALCAEHHSKADSGSFTTDQLRGLKRPSDVSVRGRFDWLRNRLLVVLGGTYCYETPVILVFRGEKSIWLTPDEEGLLRLNLKMPTISTENRLALENNDWIVRGEPIDFECPPSGKLIRARYANGDDLRIEFFELTTETIAKKYALSSTVLSEIVFPITAVELQLTVGGTNICFGPGWSKFPGITMSGCFSIRNPAALSVS
jgi:hypothetical protein